MKALFQADPNLSVGVRCPRKCLEHLGEEKCKEFGYECGEAGGLLSHCSLSVFLSPWRLVVWQSTGRLFWLCAGSSLRVMTTYLCRQVWMFCQHSSIYDRSQMWVQEHTVLYPNPEINETWLPSRPKIPKCVCVWLCVYAWVRRETGDTREGGVAGGEVLLKASSRKRSSSGKKTKVWPKVSSFLHVHFSFTTADVLSCMHTHKCMHTHIVFSGGLTQYDRQSKQQ